VDFFFLIFLCLCSALFFLLLINKLLDKLARVVQRVSSHLLSFFENCELLISHVIGHHLVVLWVFLHVKVVLVLTIGCELWLASGYKVQLLFVLGNCFLFSFESEHSLNHLETRQLWFLQLNGIAFFVKRWVGI